MNSKSPPLMLILSKLHSAYDESAFLIALLVEVKDTEGIVSLD